MAGASGPLPPPDLAARLVTALVILDADLRVAWMNDAMADLLEVGVRSLRGQPLAGLLPPGGAMLEDAVQRIGAGETVIQWRAVPLTTLRGNTYTVDFTMQSIEGGRWLLEMHALPAPGHTPTPLWATLRGVAHEVKNPLTGLRGAAQLLARRASDDATRQLAAMMIEEADRLGALTDRLLAHGDGARLAAVDLYPVIERVRQLSAAELPAIEVDYDPSLPAVTGDADRLQQVLLNLVRNAIEAGATRLTLRTRVAHHVALGQGVAHTAVRLDVIDDGPGVPADLEDQLFQPMVSGRADGTGLGLALALETAHDHGGDLRHARTAEGTVFSLYLPLDPPRGSHP